MVAYEVVGRVGGLSGNRGELNVSTFENFPSQTDTGEPLFVMIDKLAVPLFISSFRRRSATAATLLFDDFDTPERASELTGSNLLAIRGKSRADSPKKAIDFADLIGFSATINGSLKGEVTDFIDNRMNPLLEITVNGKAVYAPLADDFIDSVDTRARHISLTLPEGLTDIYLG